MQAEVRRNFITTTVREQSHRSHYKGATGRVLTGDQRYPVLCHCQLDKTSHYYHPIIIIMGRRVEGGPVAGALPASALGRAGMQGLMRVPAPPRRPRIIVVLLSFLLLLLLVDLWRDQRSAARTQRARLCIVAPAAGGARRTVGELAPRVPAAGLSKMQSFGPMVAPAVGGARRTAPCLFVFTNRKRLHRFSSSVSPTLRGCRRRSTRRRRAGPTSGQLAAAGHS